MKSRMKFYILSILFTMCSITEIYSQLQTNSFAFEGRTRYYKVFLPQNFKSNMPVVFNLHGYTLNAQWQIDYTLMNNVADTAGFIAVYPDAVYPGFNGGLVGYPGLPPIDTTINDVGFISVLIDTLAAHYDIDTNRVYCCGLSLGGIMTYRLACELSHRLAAVASVTGVLTDISGNNCNPIRSIPILHIHGTADAVVTYNGGIANLWSVDATLNLWIQNNNCLSPPDTVLLPDLDPNDGCTVQKISYTNCSDNSKIIFYKVIDGGHSWPGALTNPFAQSYPTNRDINASVEIWNFFKYYELVTSIKTIADHTPREFYLEQNYPNPFNSVTTIEFNLPRTSQISLKIFNLLGEEVAILVSEKFRAGKYRYNWDASGVAGGIYLYHLTVRGISAGEVDKFQQVRKMVYIK